MPAWSLATLHDASSGDPVQLAMHDPTAAAASATNLEYGYSQDMENNLELLHGIPLNAASHRTQFPQTLFDAPWPSRIPIASPRIQSLMPVPSYTRPQEDWLMYYFDHVAMIQYIFDPSSPDVMHAHIQQNPTGVVATAIKMIVAVHNSQKIERRMASTRRVH